MFINKTLLQKCCIKIFGQILFYEIVNFIFIFFLKRTKKQLYQLHPADSLSLMSRKLKLFTCNSHSFCSNNNAQWIDIFFLMIVSYHTGKLFYNSWQCGISCKYNEALIVFLWDRMYKYQGTRIFWWINVTWTNDLIPQSNSYFRNLSD